MIYLKHDLNDIPIYNLPEGYRFRFFKGEKDISVWTEIVTATEEFSNQVEALDRFKREFSDHLEEAKKRMIFLETTSGKAVGTATAWFTLSETKIFGRLHWVEIIPTYQGKGLGRALITRGMEVLQEKQSKAYLKTQRSSEKAIHLYKKLGWIER